jgi:hypothetical protein
MGVALLAHATASVTASRGSDPSTEDPHLSHLRSRRTSPSSTIFSSLRRFLSRFVRTVAAYELLEARPHHLYSSTMAMTTWQYGRRPCGATFPPFLLSVLLDPPPDSPQAMIRPICQLGARLGAMKVQGTCFGQPHAASTEAVTLRKRRKSCKRRRVSNPFTPRLLMSASPYYYSHKRRSISGSNLRKHWAEGKSKKEYG